MSELEIRRLELSDAEAFMVYIANWATDTSPFKIDAVKAYAELSLENFSDYVEKTHREEKPATGQKSTDILIGQQQLNILLLLMGKSLVKFLVVGKLKREFC